jgi:hypothetical protein
MIGQKWSSPVNCNDIINQDSLLMLLIKLEHDRQLGNDMRRLPEASMQQPGVQKSLCMH